MTILIVYGTNSSGTENVSQLIGGILSTAGHSVTIRRANAVDPADFLTHDVTLLGSCTWLGDVNGKTEEGQLQEHMAQLVEKCRGFRSAGQRFATFGLGDSSYDIFCGAVDKLEQFVKSLDGILVSQSLRIDGYFFDRDNNDKLVTAWTEKLLASLK